MLQQILYLSISFVVFFIEMCMKIYNFGRFLAGFWQHKLKSAKYAWIVFLLVYDVVLSCISVKKRFMPSLYVFMGRTHPLDFP